MGRHRKDDEEVGSIWRATINLPEYLKPVFEFFHDQTGESVSRQIAQGVMFALYCEMVTLLHPGATVTLNGMGDDPTLLMDHEGKFTPRKTALETMLEELKNQSNPPSPNETNLE